MVRNVSAAWSVGAGLSAITSFTHTSAPSTPAGRARPPPPRVGAPLPVAGRVAFPGGGMLFPGAPEVFRREPELPKREPEPFRREPELFRRELEESRREPEAFRREPELFPRKLFLFSSPPETHSPPPGRQKSAILRPYRRVKGWRARRNANAGGVCLWKQGGAAGRRGSDAPSGSRTRHLPRRAGEDLLDSVTLPLRHCATVPLCHCATVPLCHSPAAPSGSKTRHLPRWKRGRCLRSRHGVPTYPMAHGRGPLAEGPWPMAAPPSPSALSGLRPRWSASTWRRRVSRGGRGCRVRPG